MSCIRGLALALCPLAAWGQVYTITTIAGNGTAGFADGAATGAAQLNLPATVFVTSSGSYYIADTGNNRIRLVSGGNVSTVAGNGTAGFTGDGAGATSAELSAPFGVAVDSSGNLFFSDTNNNVVRKVSNGTITSYAGNQGFGPGYSGDGGSATSAQLYSPAALALDSAGNLYIADPGTTTALNNAIRKVTASSQIITTAIGSGSTSGRLNHPTGVAVDAAANIYIASTDNSRVFKYSNGVLTIIAGNGTAGFSGDGGPANLAQLADPQGVAVDAAGNVYIADTVNSRIRKVSNGIITTIAGTGRQGYSGDGGPATSAQLYGPDGVAVDAAGNVYVADTHNHVIRLLQPSLPQISAGGVGNAFGYQTQLSPGAWASVFGTGFGTATAAPTPNPNFPTGSGGVSVTVNGQAAALYYVSPVQINFQTPWETPVGTASVSVAVNGGASKAISVPVVSAGPGLFGTVLNSPSYSTNSTASPAPAGSTVIAYLTGSGPVSANVTDGAPAPSNPLARATSSYSASIGATPATVSFLGLAPGYVGLVQANIVIPSGLSTGSYPLTVTIAGQTSNPATISVQ